MMSLSKFFVSLMMVLVWVIPVSAQESFEFEPLDESFTLEPVEEGGAEPQVFKKASTMSYLDAHFSGGVGGYYFSGPSWNRFTKYVNASYNESFYDFKFFASGQFISTSMTADFENDRDSRYGQAPLLKRLTIDDDFAEVKQLYIDYNVADNLILSAGRQTVVWGQGDFFSPVDLLLPPDLFATKSDYSKSGRRVPTNVLRASWFPREAMELQFYYFPEYTQTPFPVSKESSDDLGRNDKRLEDVIKYPSKKEESQRAVRAMFYQDWGTIGVTYYDGWFWLPWATPSYDITTGQDLDASFQVFRQRTFALESSIPMGRLTWSFEYARIYFPFPTGSVAHSEDRSAYINWVMTQNGGKTFADSHLNVFSGGFDADLDNWLFNVYVILIHGKRSSHASEGISLYNGGEETPDQFLVPLPILHIARYFNQDKTARMGFAMGYLGASMGASLYYQQEFWESLNFRIGAEALALWSEFHPKYMQQGDYFRKDPFVAGMTASIGYRF